MAYRPRRLLAAAIAVLLSATACGGDDPKPKAGESPSASSSVTTTPTTSGSATGSPGASASGSAGTSATSRPGSSTAPGSSASTTTKPGASGSPTAKPLFLGLRLAKQCVVPGQEQSALINSEPGADFVIDTVYSDKKEGSVHGGLKNDKVDSEGRYTYTWRVLPGTPPGDAFTVVKAMKNGRRGSAIKKFRVSAIC